MESPVLFIIFNRPDTAQATFSAIRQAQPKKLFISADGPRSDRTGEAALCEKTRRGIEIQIDWPCEVQRLYSDQNLGCKEAVSSAINWFFSQVEEGIILEDDTRPIPSFFPYIETLLKRYRNNPEIMHLSGNNHQHGRIRGDGAYYASRFAHSWGWATWRRAWKHYDITMEGFPEDWESIAKQCYLSEAVSTWWRMALDNVRSGLTNTWDFQWHYTLMKHQGISLIPNKNLVENIGVGAAATHMKKRDVASSIRASELLRFDSPFSMDVCLEADRFDFSYSVMNQKVPWKTPAEYYRLWKFNRWQRGS
jgi:hypothetical protein